MDSLLTDSLFDPKVEHGCLGLRRGSKEESGASCSSSHF